MNEFPEDARPYLKEIAERLWSKQAAVMVGSGFSRNAEKNDHTKQDFPTWSGLGDRLYEKLNGKKPDSDDSYLNILKLADEVQAAFGRPVLEKLVMDSIPDMDHSPSPLHIQLLDLPWNDIFTTNYDTLLERASQNVYRYKYDLVVNKNELIYAEKPRIVKLHGSMPSERPLIISEEDYRRYPHDFAPFVNTVQQSLIENTFCLLGFSADDPNFLNWIGWINDNLKIVNAPKIYMIGVWNFSNAQIRLLQSRNIVVINLIEKGANETHCNALLKFTKFLAHYKNSERPLDWPASRRSFNSKDIPDKIDEILEEWKLTRIAYPNWVVAPLEQRNLLWILTNNFRLETLKVLTLEEPKDLQLVYEFNWRIEKCLHPIKDDELLVYEMVIAKYEVKVTNRIKSHHFDQFDEHWLTLAMAVWRYYREEGKNHMWHKQAKIMEGLLPFMDAERSAPVWYEKCLFHMITNDYTIVQEYLEEWPSHPGLPYWEAKRAALLAEVGMSGDAATTLETALTNVRKRVAGIKNTSDFTWVSQESYLMQLLRYVLRSIRSAKGDIRMEEDNKDFTDRNNTLKLYNCDPWRELQTFELQLQEKARDFSQPERRPMYQIGKYNTTHHLGGINKHLLPAYQFLRYLEDTGIPPRLGIVTYGEKALNEAIIRIGPYSRPWALGMIIRSKQHKSAEELLTREFVSKLSRNQCNQYINHFVEIFEKTLERWDKSPDQQQTCDAILATLSRLVVKSEFASKSLVVSLLLKIYNSNIQWRLNAIPELWKLLFDSLSSREKVSIIKVLLKFPVASSTSDSLLDLPEPFRLLKISSKDADATGYKPDKGTVASLMKLAVKTDGLRTNALHRLITLYMVGFLSPSQTKTLASSLWSVRDVYGLPYKSEYAKFSFISLPCPSDVDPKALFKEYILANEPVIGKSPGNNLIELTWGKDQTISDLINGTKRLNFNHGVVWSDGEARIILEKMVSWWDSDKKQLLKKESSSTFGDIPGEFRRRFRNLNRVLNEVLAPTGFWKNDESISGTITRLICEMADHGLPTVHLRFSYIELFPEFEQDLLGYSARSLASNNQEVAVDAFNMIIDCTKTTDKRNNLVDKLTQLLTLVAQQIKWRNYPILKHALNTFGIALENCPNALIDEQLEDVEFGLEYLLSETRENVAIPIDETLVFRKYAVSLAHRLYQFYKERRLKIPFTIINWKEAMNSDDEFDDIKKAWLNK